MTRDRFISSHGTVQVYILDDITMIRQHGVSAILTQPIHVGGGPDSNYVHGFLERYGPLFWTLSEIQSHRTYINPSKIQLYYSSKMHTDHGRNVWLPI
ncbi:unnamed protein product [Rotaria sp. Silwood1]|nr:unnamed protein product [Rotaria sp. Silwood1]